MLFKTALVTGGAGFIGSHLVDALVADGVQVFVVDNLSTGVKAHVNPAAEFFKVSVATPAFSKLILRLKPDAIFHLAAQVSVPKSVEDPVADAQTNVVGTLRLLEASAKAGVKKIVFSSSGGALYADPKFLPYAETAPAEPPSPYGIAKRAAELYFGFGEKVLGVPCVALRYANVYGPRQNVKGEGAVISTFAKRLLANKPVTIDGTGTNTRDFVYVGDVVAANLAAAQSNATGVFNIGTGKETSIGDLFRRMKRFAESTSTEHHGPARPADVHRSALNVRKAKSVLGWEPKVSLPEGLKETMEWYRRS